MSKLCNPLIVPHMLLHKHIVKKKELKFCLLMAGCFVMLADANGMRASAMFLKLTLNTFLSLCISIQKMEILQSIRRLFSSFDWAVY